MDESKKRKLEEAGNGELSSTNSEQHLRLLLDPLRKDQLVDLLAKLLGVHLILSLVNNWEGYGGKKQGTQYPTVAEEIRGVASSDPVHRKLFVRGLAWETTSETLRAAFCEYGEIEEGAVIVDKATGKSRGYGFITYKHMESAQRALRDPSKLIDGRLAVCNLACEGLSSTSVSSDIALRKIYIGGLSPDTSSEILLNFFSRHGEIEEGSVAYDKETNKSRGFGFVTYKTVEAAKMAIDDPNNTLGGRNITVKLADIKNRAMQGQLPPTILPIPVPVQAGYPQPVKNQVATTAPLTYAPYPQPLSAYPTSYPNAPAEYPNQAHISYTPVAAKKDPMGLSAASPSGLAGYPYYITKPYYSRFQS